MVYIDSVKLTQERTQLREQWAQLIKDGDHMQAAVIVRRIEEIDAILW